MNCKARSFTVYRLRALVALFLALALHDAVAQVDIYSNYEERLGSRQPKAMQAGDEAFGAKVDVATGAVSFYVPVLSIPGNNGLDITVSYKLTIRNFAGSTQWNFEEEKPYLSGSFSKSAGWTTELGGDARCSNNNGVGAAPPDVPSSNGRSGQFYANEYWYGYSLSLPGSGGGSLNRYRSGAPSPPISGGPYYWATNAHWYFSCIPLVAGGVGEGFVGRSPDGLKYFFNTMREGLPVPDLNKHNAQDGELELYREELRIYADRIEDRYGNYINGLTASDGRNVIKTVSGSSTIYTYGDRQWIVNTSNPYTVTYPDGSVWSASTSGQLYDWVSVKASCPSESVSTTPAVTEAEIKSPGGATGTYTLKQVLIGYSYVSGQCITLDDGSSVIDNSSLTIVPALVKRTISGPGMALQVLDVDYGDANNCYTVSPFGPVCNAASPTFRTIIYSYSDGKFHRYTFGNKWLENSNLLLKLEEGKGVSYPSLRTTEYEYSLLPSVGVAAGPIPYSVGATKRVVMRARTIEQDGRLFTWNVPSQCGSNETSLCVDEYGRPAKIIRASAPVP